MQTPVFLLLFFAPVYVPLALLEGWIEVNAKLNDIVVRAFEETWSTRERYATTMRMAAYGIAVQRVAEATTIRGLYP